MCWIPSDRTRFAKPKTPRTRTTTTPVKTTNSIQPRTTTVIFKIDLKTMNWTTLCTIRTPLWHSMNFSTNYTIYILEEIWLMIWVHYLSHFWYNDTSYIYKYFYLELRILKKNIFTLIDISIMKNCVFDNKVFIFSKCFEHIIKVVLQLLCVAYFTFKNNTLWDILNCDW